MNSHFKIPASTFIKQKAQGLGFSACGIAPAEPISAERIAMRDEMLSLGHHADMDYLERNEEKRRDPRLLVEGVKSIVSVAMEYAPRPQDAPPIAAYALGRDYHDSVKDKLRMLASSILADINGNFDGEVRCFVDSAPVDERYWAWRCGIGFIGRSGMLIVPHIGSRIFLGEVFLPFEVDAYDVPLTADISSYEHCGKCRRCSECCPGHALTNQGLDARRCLSYLTIENRGELPDETGVLMHAKPGTSLFYGCDRCVELCPYNAGNKTAEACEKNWNAVDWQHLSLEEYRELFRGSAVKRAKYEGLMRNIRAFYGTEDTKEQ